MYDSHQEPGFGCLLGLLLLGCVVQALTAFDSLLVGRSFWSPILLVAVTALLILGCSAYAQDQARHPAWGLLGILNLFGLALLLILPEFEASAEGKRKGFAVLRVRPVEPVLDWEQNESTMRVHVKLFAILRERAGASEATLQLRPGATIADASAALADKFPGLASFLPRVAYALNESYAKPDAALSEGDELALIPPVSGGAFE